MYRETAEKVKPRLDNLSPLPVLSTRRHMAGSEREKFTIIAHSGTYDKLYQVASLGLTAAVMGKDVYVFLFFWALKKFTDGTLDQADSPVGHEGESERLAQVMKEKKIPTISEMIRDAKALGNLKIIACSAQPEIMEIAKDGMGTLIDDVWGLPTILNTMRGAQVQLFI